MNVHSVGDALGHGSFWRILLASLGLAPFPVHPGLNHLVKLIRWLCFTRKPQLQSLRMESSMAIYGDHIHLPRFVSFLLGGHLSASIFNEQTLVKADFFRP